MARKNTKKKGYKHPIPARNDLLDHLEAAGRPVKADKIMAELGLNGQRTRGLLIDRLYKMVRAGQVIENRRVKFCLTATRFILFSLSLPFNCTRAIVT